MKAASLVWASVSVAAVLAAFWFSPAVQAGDANDAGTSGGAKLEAEKLDKIKPLLDDAQRKWQEWEPVLSQAAKRLQKEYQDSGKWEYDVMAVGTDDAGTLAARLNKKGQEGWECFGTVQLRAGEHLLLRKRHDGPLAQLPMKELMGLIMYQSVISGGQR